MALTQLFTIPATTLKVGTHGPFTSQPLSAPVTAFQAVVSQGVGWPSGGSDVMRMDWEVSRDGGVTWESDSSVTWAAAPWVDHGVTNTTSTLFSAVNLNVGDMIRATLTVFRQCAPSAVVSVFS